MSKYFLPLAASSDLGYYLYFSKRTYSECQCANIVVMFTVWYCENTDCNQISKPKEYSKLYAVLECVIPCVFLHTIAQLSVPIQLQYCGHP